MRTLALFIVAAGLFGCPPSAPCGFFPGTTTPAPCPSDAGPIDAAGLRSYVCPVGDSGASWTCQDGLTTEAGTCAHFGCVPVTP